jgi:hypothetical protein
MSGAMKHGNDSSPGIRVCGGRSTLKPPTTYAGGPCLPFVPVGTGGSFFAGGAAFEQALAMSDPQASAKTPKAKNR